SGGNSGSQASTLVIRAIALGEVMLSDWWRVMRREVAAGLTLGSILGTIGFLRITIWSAFSNLYGPHWLLVAVTSGRALVGGRLGWHQARQERDRLLQPLVDGEQRVFVLDAEHRVVAGES